MTSKTNAMYTWCWKLRKNEVIDENKSAFSEGDDDINIAIQR